MMNTSLSNSPAQPQNVPQATSSAQEMVHRLLGIMNELTQIMVDEIPMIEQPGLSKRNFLLERKQELTLDYQSVMKVFSENQDLLKGLSQENVSQLRSSGKKLDEVTEKNAKALRFAHHANEHLLKVVINQIRKDMYKESGYSGRGVLALAESHQARPISVNQKI